MLNSDETMQTLADQNQLKAVFKAAFIEVLEERPDLIRDAIEDALEEIALARAIEAGKDSEAVSRDEVFSLLKGAS